MITSTSNGKIKNVILLASSNKARREQDSFIAEGIKMFMEAPVERIKEVYISEALEKKLNNSQTESDEAISKKLHMTEYNSVSDSVFKKMSDTMTPQGILVVLKRMHYGLEELSCEKSLKILVLENIQDPGNLGTMIRTAEGAGMNLILASRDTVDVYNPKVIRSTMGSVYRVPLFYSDDLERDIVKLKSFGVKFYAAHLKGKSFYNEVEYPDKTAIMIGNEGNGLSDRISLLSDEYIKIPMAGQLESLNASVAAAILMYSI